MSDQQKLQKLQKAIETAKTAIAHGWIKPPKITIRRGVKSYNPECPCCLLRAKQGRMRAARWAKRQRKGKDRKSMFTGLLGF